ncbi:hypothetical protein BH09PSE5_BH09PSE5_33900 [soil metagenome]
MARPSSPNASMTPGRMLCTSTSRLPMYWTSHASAAGSAMSTVMARLLRLTV